VLILWKKPIMPSQDVFKIRVELQDMPVPVYRELWLPADLYLVDLHKIIQTSMSWLNGHLHAFRHGGNSYMPFDETNEMGAVAYEDIPISQFLQKPGDSMVYVYDFGDNWRHTIILKEVQAARKNQFYPFCAAGTGATPPEDIGGAPGYARFLEALNDKNHPEHEDVLDFLGEMTWDPEEFFRESINDLLQEEDYGMFNLTDFFMNDMMELDINIEEEGMNGEDMSLKEAVDEIIANQLRDEDPPETKQTIRRLLDQGWSEEDALILVGQCVMMELFLVMQEEEETFNLGVFNQERYLKNLKALPNEPREVWTS